MWFDRFIPKLPVVKAEDEAEEEELVDPQQALRVSPKQIHLHRKMFKRLISSRTNATKLNTASNYMPNIRNAMIVLTRDRKLLKYVQKN